jgi:glycosyltransferase involved in cell wall biosynthesis
MNNKRLFIIIGGQLTTSRVAHLRKILEIGTKLFERIVIIQEGRPLNLNNVNIKVISVDSQDIKVNIPFPRRVIGYITQEIKKSKVILKHVKKTDTVLFLGIYQPLSLFSVKVRGGFSIIFGGGFDVTRSVTGNKFLDTLYFTFRWPFQITMLKAFNKIILESQSVKDFYNLKKFNRKICYAHLHLPNTFTLINPLNQRDIDVAFMGVLSKEKGIFEFLQACDVLKNRNVSMKIMIWGDGILRDEVRRYISDNNLSNLVQLNNFVDPRNVPKLLNRIKLIVIPSYSEGLPNILLEAMACGAPVLATPVGGIPDVIKEGKTGFLLNSNNPGHIAKRIVELLNEPELLERVSINAYNYVRENFSYEKTLETWRKIIKQLEQA